MDNKLQVTLGLVPENCKNPNTVAISEFSITYTQNPDTNSQNDDYQYIKVTARNNGVGEDGWYYDIQTEEGHWSVDDPEMITEIIKDFKSRMEHNVVKEKDIEVYK